MVNKNDLYKRLSLGGFSGDSYGVGNSCGGR